MDGSILELITRELQEEVGRLLLKLLPAGNRNPAIGQLAL